MSANRPDLASPSLSRLCGWVCATTKSSRALGNAHKAMASREKAVDCYRHSLALNQECPPSLYNLGLILHEMNRLEEAEGFFRRFCEIEPRDVDALIHLELVYCKRSRFVDGGRTFRLALELAPGNPFLWMCLGNACREIPGRLDESIRHLRKCIELEPGLAPAHWELGAASYNGLGCALLRKNTLDNAMDSFRKAIGLQPALAGAHLNLGNALGLRGAWDEAVRSFQPAYDSVFRARAAAMREVILEMAGGRGRCGP